MAHQLPITRLPRLYFAERLVLCYLPLHRSVRQNCKSDLGKEILRVNDVVRLSLWIKH